MAQYKALLHGYAGTRFEEQLQLHLPQKHKATVPDSTLHIQMNGLEEQADNAQARDLYWKPLSWLGTIGPTSSNDAFDPAMWTTFVSTTLGLEVPVLSSLSSHNKSQLAKCCCKKHCMDFHGNREQNGQEDYARKVHGSELTVVCWRRQGSLGPGNPRLLGSWWKHHHMCLFIPWWKVVSKGYMS